MIELVVTDIMTRAADHRAHLLMLRERDGLRKIVVALGMYEAQSIAFAMRKVQPPRPLPHDLFVSFSSLFGIKLQYSLVCGISDGTFCSQIFFEQGGVVKSLDSRTSDAIALALRENAPIYITDELLDRMCVRDEGNGAVSLPISVVDEETLRQAMDKAVKEENYELAMKLKEEIDSRRHIAREDDSNDTNTI